MRFIIVGLLCLVPLFGLYAQLCEPAPGPALFFEDFGSGANPGPALTNASTSFVYGSIDEGHYFVSNTTGINLSSWHDGLDHTEGDTNGYMLIFNATEGPGVFYQRTFTDLCPNTDYIFTYHLTNLAVPVACIGFSERPDVRVSAIHPVNEVVQATETTGEVWYSSLLTWSPYSLRFRTDTDQTSVMLRLTNEAPGGCGNDLAIDDISLQLCNPQIQQSFDLCDLPEGSITVGTNTYTQAGTYFDLLPVPDSCNDTLVTTLLNGEERRLPPIRYTICEGDTLTIGDQVYTASTTLIDTVAGSTQTCPLFQPTEIIVQSGITTTQDVVLCFGDQIQVGNNSYSDAGTYLDSLTTTSGCDSVVITNVTTGTIGVIVTPAAVALDFGESIQLMSTIDFSSNYTLRWEPQQAFSCTDCLNPIFQPTASGIFQVIATDMASGCQAEATIDVSVRNCEKIFIPNAFSPNFDGINDHLMVFSEPCFNHLVSWHIFDRWGGLVYEANEQPLQGDFTGWNGQVNGQAAQRGIYTYLLVLARTDGSLTRIQGEVMLIH